MQLDKLTKEHKIILAKTKKEWLNLAFNENKVGINKPLFEEGINWLYQDLLQKEKPKIVYVDSWLLCLIEINSFKNSGQKLIPIWKLVKDSIQTSVREPIIKIVEDIVDTSIIKTVTGMEVDVGKFIEDYVWFPLFPAVRDSFTPIESSPFSDFCVYLGWENISWIAKYDFFERIEVFQNNNFTNYKNLIKSNAFAVYEYEDVVFAIQPPIKMERNKNGLLHSFDNCAIEFRDGYKYYFVNGQIMPEWLFVNGFTQIDIDEMKDEDIKAGMYEILKFKNKDEKK